MQPMCYPCPGTYDPKVSLGTCSGRGTCRYSKRYRLAYCADCHCNGQGCNDTYVGPACEVKLGPGVLYETAKFGESIDPMDFGALAVPPYNFFGLNLDFHNGFSFTVNVLGQNPMGFEDYVDPTSKPPAGAEGLTGVAMSIDLMNELNIPIKDLSKSPMFVQMDMSQAPLAPGTDLQILLYNPFDLKWEPPCPPPNDVCTILSNDTLLYLCMICHTTQFNGFAPQGAFGARAPLGSGGDNGAPPPGPLTLPPVRTVFPPGTTPASTVVVSVGVLALAFVASLLLV